MSSLCRAGALTAAVFHRSLALVAAAVVLALFPAIFASAGTAADSLSDGDKQCLGCHASEAMQKDLGGGKTLSLHVPGEAFARSVHAAIGCSACHAEVDLKTHPQQAASIPSARAYSIAMIKVCSACHAEVSKHQEGSVHDALLRQGNAAAPVCTDCHGTHAITPKTAYATCVGCHDTTGSHRKWLPNAGLHLEVVSCAACHAPTAQRMVDLRLYDGVAKKWVSEQAGAPQFERLARAADADGNGLDALELRNLMGKINHDQAAPQQSLRGRIELRAGAQAHQLSGKAQAIKECASCHQQGAEPFQNVTVSSLSAEGKPLRYKAQKEVLSSALSVESLREFYAVGGTRSVLLDMLLLLAVCGGLSVPIGHQLLKRIVQRQLRREAGDKASTNPEHQDRA